MFRRGSAQGVKNLSLGFSDESTVDLAGIRECGQRCAAILDCEPSVHERNGDVEQPRWPEFPSRPAATHELNGLHLAAKEFSSSDDDGEEHGGNDYIQQEARSSARTEVMA